MTLTKLKLKKHKWGAMHDKVRAIAEALHDGQKPDAKKIAEQYKCTRNYAYLLVAEARKMTGITKPPPKGGSQLSRAVELKRAMANRPLPITMEESNVDGERIKFGDIVGGLQLFDMGGGRGRWVKKEEPEADVDMVNHPPHYTAGGIETIDFIQAKLTPEEFRGYLRGNILKYSSRAGLKGDAMQDIDKMVWYANKLQQTS